MKQTIYLTAEEIHALFDYVCANPEEGSFTVIQEPNGIGYVTSVNITGLSKTIQEITDYEQW